MDSQLEWRIATFFQYWQRRLDFIKRLDFNKNNHEANVLIYAALDALSNLWAEHIGKEDCMDIKGKRSIFDAFLSHYGGEVFKTVSLPDVWNRVDKGNTSIGRSSLPIDVIRLLREVGDRQKPTLVDERQFRQSSDDWRLSRIVDTVLAEYPTTDCKCLESWLTISKYGAIAYKEMRSSYFHEGRLGRNSHSFSLMNSATRPTYLSGIYTTPPAIGFSADFMVKVLEDCLNAFEHASLIAEQDPVPE